MNYIFCEVKLWSLYYEEIHKIVEYIDWFMMIDSCIIAGGLGSYTPSKIQMTETPFQLGVSQQKQNGQQPKKKEKEIEQEEEVLRPSEDATSWSGSSSTSDLLFWSAKKTRVKKITVIMISRKKPWTL